MVARAHHQPLARGSPKGYDDRVEQRLGPYLILETIGRGAAGRVFRARSPEGREVALKLLIGSLSPQSLGRFERERKLLSQLGHDLGFVPLLDAGTTPHGPYVVMELMHGGSLRDRLQRSGRLDLASGIELGADLASALSAAHARGVVHRDLKPGNILFTREGALRVADLGLAKAYEDTSDSLSKTGILRGTIGYMPPEQMLDAKRAGPPADVFAWAAVLYESLTGEPAFGNGPPMEVVYNLESGKFQPIRELRPDVPGPLAALIGRCLAKDPQERPRDGAALAAELAAATLDSGGGSRAALGALLGLGALLLLGVGVAIGVRVAAPAAPSPAASELARGESPAPGRVSPSRSVGALPSPSENSAPPLASPSPTPLGFRTLSTAIPTHLDELRRGKRLSLRAVLGSYRGRHLGLVTDVAWGPGGRYVVTVELAGWVRIWNPGTGDVVMALRTPQRLHAVDTGEGVWGVVGGDDGAVLLRLDGTTGIKELPKRGKCVSVRFIGPDRVVVTEGTGLAAYEVPSGRELWRVADAHAGEGTFVNGLRYVAARDEIVTGAKSVRVWSAKDGKALRTFELPPNFPVEDLTVSPKGDRIFVSGQTPRLFEFQRDGSADGTILDFAQPGYTRALETLPSGALFTGHDDGSILFRATGSVKIGQHSGWVHGLRLSKDLRLASVGNDTQLRVWTHPTQGQGAKRVRPAWSPSGHLASVEQLEVQGQRVYSRGRDGLRVWDRGSARELQALPPETALMGRRATVMLAISPSGGRVVRLGLSMAVDDLETGRVLQWNNKTQRAEFLNPSFVDENTLSVVNVRGEESRIDLRTKQLERVPHAGDLMALRWVRGLGWVRVFSNRLEVETKDETVRSSLAERPEWALVDVHGTMVLIAKGMVVGITFERETGRFRSVRAPYAGQLTCVPAFSADLRWLAIGDGRGLVLVDTKPAEPVVADRLDLVPHGERIGALAWARSGELWVGTRFGPLLCYEVR